MVHVSYMEIYNDKLFDLLLLSAGGGGSSSTGVGKEKDLVIREVRTGCLELLNVKDSPAYL